MPLPVVGGVAGVEVADLGGGGQTSHERDMVMAGLGYKEDASAFWSMLAWPSTGACLHGKQLHVRLLIPASLPPSSLSFVALKCPY